MVWFGFWFHPHFILFMFCFAFLCQVLFCFVFLVWLFAWAWCTATASSHLESRACQETSRQHKPFFIWSVPLVQGTCWMKDGGCEVPNEALDNLPGWFPQTTWCEPNSLLGIGLICWVMVRELNALVVPNSGDHVCGRSPSLVETRGKHYHSVELPSCCKA